MRVYFRYAVKETLSNLWRNRMMTIAAVLTVAVSLSLVGSALLLKQSAGSGSRSGAGYARDRLDGAHGLAGEIANIQTQLHNLPIVKRCQYRTQAQDYVEMKNTLPPSESNILKPSQIPTKFSCVPTVPSDAFTVQSTFMHQPGVLTVTAPEQQIREMNHVIRILQIVFLALALVLLLSATVLILNTIRMAIFSRRREVSVMKLVGATTGSSGFPISPRLHPGTSRLGSGYRCGDRTSCLVSVAQRISVEYECTHRDEHRRLDRGRRDWLRRFGNRDSPIPRRLVTVFVEVDGEGVDAVAQTR